MADRSVTVLNTGPEALIQDAGRHGWLSAGVGRSGAADLRSYELATRLLANPAGTAAIECLLGGLSVRLHCSTLITVTGAPAPLTVDGLPHGHASVVPVAAGQIVTLGIPPSGLRSYLGIRGGIKVPAVLGSRSSDTLSGIGPDRLSQGAVLPLGPEPRAWPIIDLAPVIPPSNDELLVRARLGPRDDWFVDPTTLYRTSWTVSPASNRIGLRLQLASGGTPLERSVVSELPSEGMPLGAIQVAPGGEPVVFLADHPVTGGYPIIATVLTADIPLMAQARPGQQVRFVPPSTKTRRA